MDKHMKFTEDEMQRCMGTGIQHFLKNLGYDMSRIRALIYLLIYFLYIVKHISI